jgi:hypothetical protein
MMRPLSVALPPIKADGLSYTIIGNGNKRQVVLSWNDNSINETSFLVQSLNANGSWSDVGPVVSPLDQANTHGTRSFTVPTFFNPNLGYQYRVVAQNTIGYGSGFPTLTVKSISDPLPVNLPAAPTALTAVLQSGPQIRLTWTDNATSETGFVIERSADGVAFAQIGTAPARNNTGSVTFIDNTFPLGATNATFTYRVAAVNLAGSSNYAVSAAVLVPAVPALPGNLTAVIGPNNNNSRSVILNWTDNSTNETGFTVQRATNAAFTSGVSSIPVGANLQTLPVTGLSRNTAYYFRIRANNGAIIFSNWVNASPFPITTAP